MTQTGSRRPAESRAAAQPAPAPAPAPPAGAVIFALLALTFLIGVLTIFQMSNNDIWIHLRTGQIILDTWQVPDKDPYSFTAAHHDYVAHEWLSGVLFQIVYAAGGVTGLIFFKGFVILATCAALLAACLKLSVRLSIALPCFGLMLFIGSARFLERPHIFSYLFIALYVLCYVAWRKDGRRGWLYAIPVLHILWTNLHGGHFQGLALLVMFALAEAVMLVRARWFGLAVADARLPRDVLLVALLVPASLLTALINPYGLRLLTFPFELTGQETFMKGIYEWMPALNPAYNISAMFLYYILWTSVLFGSFLLVRGHRELRGPWRDAAWAANAALGAVWLLFVIEMAQAYKATPPTLLERHFVFWCLTVGFFLLSNFHRLEFHHAGIVALFFMLSMRHNRAVTDCAVATLPTLAHNLNELLTRAAARRRWRLAEKEGAALIAGGVVLAGLAWYTAVNSYAFNFSPTTKREMGLGIASNMPVSAVDYIAHNRIGGRAMPSYNAAAMLIHRGWPEVKVAMDSRNDVYGETLYKDYTQALRGGALLDQYLRRHDIDFVLLTYVQDRSEAIYLYLDTSPEWSLVYFDDRQIVYLRDRPQFESIIQRDGYELLAPAREQQVEISLSQAPQFLEEANRAVAAAPDAWSPLQYQSKALMALERYDEALVSVQKLLAIYPQAWFAWADLGYLSLRQGRADLAEQAYLNCLRVRPDFRPCQENLMRLRRPRIPQAPGSPG